MLALGLRRFLSCSLLQHILWFSSSTLMETDLDVLTTEETDDLGVIW